MRFKFSQLAAVLIGLALCVMPAAAFTSTFSSNPVHHVPVGLMLIVVTGLSAVAGTITYTYESFQHSGQFGGGFTGGAAAPSAAQASQVNLQTGQVQFTDTDTSWTHTHNWALSTAQVAALLPLVTLNVIAGVQAVGTAVAPVISVVVGANAVGFTKLQATGSGCTMSVAIRRPSTIGS